MSALLAYAGLSVAGAVVGVLASVQIGVFAGLARALIWTPAEDAAPFRFGLAGRTPHA